MHSQRLKGLLPNLVANPREARNIEYKRALSWDEAKYLVARAALGLVNLRDGGIIVIGVKEEGNDLIPTGLTPDQVDTYNADDVASLVSSFGSEAIEIVFESVEELIQEAKMKFIVIEISQFRAKPIFAKKGSPIENDPQTKKPKIEKGVLYVRPYGGKPESRPATAEDHEDLLQLAVDMRLRSYVEMTARAGLEVRFGEPLRSDAERFAMERGDL